jgi:hypothetical protein
MLRYLAAAVVACLGPQALAAGCPVKDQHGESCVSAIKNERQPMNNGKDTNFVITYQKNPSCRGIYRVMATTNEGKELSNGFAGNETTINCTTTMGCTGLRERFRFECSDDPSDSSQNTSSPVAPVPTKPTTPTTPTTTLAPAPAPAPPSPRGSIAASECSSFSCSRGCDNVSKVLTPAQGNACKQRCESQLADCRERGLAQPNFETAAKDALYLKPANPPPTPTSAPPKDTLPLNQLVGEKFGVMRECMDYSHPRPGYRGGGGIYCLPEVFPRGYETDKVLGTRVTIVPNEGYYRGGVPCCEGRPWP